MGNWTGGWIIKARIWARRPHFVSFDNSRAVVAAVVVGVVVVVLALVAAAEESMTHRQQRHYEEPNLDLDTGSLSEAGSPRIGRKRIYVSK